MLTDQQVKKLSKIYLETGNITMSSLKVNIDRKTGSRYIKLGKLPSELKKPHTWPTRKDPFKDVERELKSILSFNHDFEAKTAFDFLQQKYPGRYPDGQLRTLQRRFIQWKLDLGIDSEIYFEQLHIPGRIMELDWTDCNTLQITINGDDFEHKLCHTVLVYSKWEWAEICFSESFLSLKRGFQSAVKQLGKAPLVLKTDNSSTATHYAGKKSEREFNCGYSSFCRHFNITPAVINVRKPNENGSIESSNNNLKRKINQYLILRGSRDFSSVAEYSKFIKTVMGKLNMNRSFKFNEELPFMQKLPPVYLPEYKEEVGRVSKFSTVRFDKKTYSMPSKYRDCELRGRIYDDRIDVYHKTASIAKLPRIHSGENAFINYRHVIKHLLRKPGAFENYKYRDFMFPNGNYKVLHENLCVYYGGRRGDREYLEILNLAAAEGERKILSAVSSLQNSKTPVCVENIKGKINLRFSVPAQKSFVPKLSEYDAKFLIAGGL